MGIVEAVQNKMDLTKKSAEDAVDTVFDCITKCLAQGEEVSISGFGAFIKTASVSGINQATIAGMLVIIIIVFVINRMVWAPLLAESAKRYAE